MNEPWFDPNLYAWIPGTLLGLFGALWGTLVGVCGPRGKARGLVTGLFRAGAVACAALLGAGAVALLARQPYGVWYGLGFPGGLGLVLLLVLRPVMRRTYAQHEALRMQARDLGS